MSQRSSTAAATGTMADKVTIVGSVVGAASPKDNLGYKTPLAWIMFITALWCIAWAVIFILVEVDIYSYLNNWWGVLWYFIGAALIEWLAQLIALGFYLSRKRTQLKLAAANTGKTGATVETLANNGIVIVAVFASLITSVYTGFLWYTWLCVYSNACAFTTDSSITDLNTADEKSVHVYKYQFLVSIVLQLLTAFLELKAFFSIIVPLHYLGSFGAGVILARQVKIEKSS